MNKKPLKLIRKWSCDACGEEIDGVRSGWVEWLSPMHSNDCYGLRLAHRNHSSPAAPAATTGVFTVANRVQPYWIYLLKSLSVQLDI